ncbi:MAG: hypothetical protein ACK53L_03830, partial [Pirellulaceae bacterium]
MLRSVPAKLRNFLDPTSRAEAGSVSMASPQPFRAKPRPPTFDYISTAAPRRHRASQEHPTDSMRNKPAVQTALLGRAILHVRSRRANSRTSLAKVMELSPSTIGLYVDQLLKDA